MRISDGDMIVALSRALSQLLTASDVESATKTVVEELEAEREKPSAAPILTVSGRILFDLMHSPDSSLQECADRLGLTSANVAHVMTRLVEDGLVVRTRVGVKNSYQFSLNALTKHRDITLIFHAATALAEMQEDHGGDITLTEQ